MARPTKPLKDKLRDNTTVDPVTGCWVWTSGKMLNNMGRPRVLHNGTWMMASRAAYWEYKGYIAADQYACHTCDNKLCVNPDHLFAGSAKDNTQDCIAKGRWKREAWTGGKCDAGHELIDENIVEYLGSDGYMHRRCRRCANVAAMRSYDKLQRSPHVIKHIVPLDVKTGPRLRAPTHCKAGHEFTDANTQWRQEGKYWKRSCKTCKADKAYAKYRSDNGLSAGDPKKRYRYG